MKLRNGRTLTQVATVLLSATWALQAAADPLSRVTLLWTAPADCPNTAALQAGLRRDLKGSLVPGERLDVRASVDRPAKGNWRVTIQLRSGEGTSDRVLEADSCVQLADATSLIIAMQIDPETAAAHANGLETVAEASLALPPYQAPVPGVPVVAYPGLVVPPVPANAQRSADPSATKTINTNKEQERAAPVGRIESVRTTFDAAAPQPEVPGSRLRAFVGGWALGDAGSLQLVSLAVGGCAGIEYARWLGEAAFGAWLPREKSVDSDPNPQAGVKLSMVSGAARLCYRVWGAERFTVSPCAGFELVRWAGQGNAALATQQNQPAFGFSPDARLLGTLSVSEALSLPVFLDVLLPLNHPRFGFLDAAGMPVDVLRPWSVAFRLGAGVQLHFR